MEHSDLSEKSPSNPSPQVSGNPLEEDAKSVQEPEGMGKKTKSARQSSAAAQRNTQSLKHHAQGLHRSEPDEVLELKRKVDTNYIPNPEATYNC